MNKAMDILGQSFLVILSIFLGSMLILGLLAMSCIIFDFFTGVDVLREFIRPYLRGILGV